MDEQLNQNQQVNPPQQPIAQSAGVILPFEGTTPPAPHISLEVLNQAAKEIDTQLKQNAQLQTQHQSAFNDIQKNLNQIQLNGVRLEAQKAMVVALSSRITELLKNDKF